MVGSLVSVVFICARIYDLCVLRSAQLRERKAEGLEVPGSIPGFVISVVGVRG